MAGKGKKTVEGVLCGQRIAEARKGAPGGPMNLNELAARTKIGASTLGNYEQGTRKLPIRAAKAVQKATGYPAAYLMGLVDEGDRDLLMASPEARKSLLEAIRQLAAGPFRRTGSD